MKADFPNLPSNDLEVRITALLLGELSPEEEAAVRQAIARDPELAKLHARLQQTIALVREVEAQPAGSLATQPVAAKLSAERRQRLLQRFRVISVPELVSPTGPSQKWLMALGLAAVLMILAAISIPNFTRARETASLNSVANNWRILEGAKEQWAFENKKSPGDRVTLEDLKPYVKNNELPMSVAGEKYLAGTVSEPIKVEFNDPKVEKAFAQAVGVEPRVAVPSSEVGFQLFTKIQSKPAAILARADRRAQEVAMARARSTPEPTAGPAPAPSAASTRRQAIYLPATDAAGEVGDADRSGGTTERLARTVEAMDISAGYAGVAGVGGGGGGGFGGGGAGTRDDGVNFWDTPGVAGGVAGSGLYRNNGNGAFTRSTSDEAPLAALIPSAGQELAVGKPAGQTAGGAAWADYDSDGLLDLWVSNPPTLGDQPTLGRLFQSADVSAQHVAGKGVTLSPEADQLRKTFTKVTKGKVANTDFFSVNGRGDRGTAPAKPAEARAVAVDEVAQALEPLDLKLPVPAFVGAPVDLPLLSAPVTGPALHVAQPSAVPDTQAPDPSAGGVFSVNAVGYANNDLKDLQAIAEPQPEQGGRPEGSATVLGYGLAKGQSAVSTGVSKGEALEQQVRLGEELAERRGGVGLEGKSDERAGEQQLAFGAERLPALQGLTVGGSDSRLRGKVELTFAQEELARVQTDTAPLATNAVAAPLAQEEEKVIARPLAPAPVPQPEVSTADNPISTFSLNVSDVSFKLAASSLEAGAMPDPGSIRTEEFINAFDYHDPEPLPGVPIAFAWERAHYPFAHNRDLIRLSLQTAARGREAGRPLNLVLLLDSSGSMERADRVSIIREALRVLAGQLKPEDKISVVAFARTARLWIDGLPGSQAAELVQRVGNLTPEGGTNLEDAMTLAYQTAARHYLANGANRVVLLTDGAANLGDVDPDSLKQKVESNRRQGIALDCFGIGWEGYNDDLLEVLSRNGDGRYGFVNSPEEAATGFANQLAGALQVAASDVKVQVEFNPARATTYRQIGYAKHQLTKEQFRDNTVDAAEIGAAEAGNALYTVEVNPRGEGPIGIVRVRYRVPATGEYREHEWEVPYRAEAVALDRSSPAMRLAGSAAAFSEWLASSPFAAEVAPDRLLGLLGGVPEAFGADPRPKRLEWMIRQAQSIRGK